MTKVLLSIKKNSKDKKMNIFLPASQNNLIQCFQSMTYFSVLATLKTFRKHSHICAVIVVVEDFLLQWSSGYLLIRHFQHYSHKTQIIALQSRTEFHFICFCCEYGCDFTLLKNPIYLILIGINKILPFFTTTGNQSELFFTSSMDKMNLH